MKKLLAATLGTFGFIAANCFSTACIFLWLDEPETPQHLIK